MSKAAQPYTVVGTTVNGEPQAIAVIQADVTESIRNVRSLRDDWLKFVFATSYEEAASLAVEALRPEVAVGL